MNEKEFRDWLVNEKKIVGKSAGDVLSRLKRVKRILNQEEITEESISLLLRTQEYQACSFAVRSQLKRSINLYLEYK